MRKPKRKQGKTPKERVRRNNPQAVCSWEGNAYIVRRVQPGLGEILGVSSNSMPGAWADAASRLPKRP